jgi:hypothetical protein
MHPVVLFGCLGAGVGLVVGHVLDKATNPISENDKAEVEYARSLESVQERICGIGGKYMKTAGKVFTVFSFATISAGLSTNIPLFQSFAKYSLTDTGINLACWSLLGLFIGQALEYAGTVSARRHIKSLKDIQV